ncbi:MAG: ParB/RepB/Spo0J family partition protein [Rhodobacteraceae bacterium]|nr:MAG: ParB/RepB/Spo0J family partition protein [Paracoccaceae bacterium]
MAEVSAAPSDTVQTRGQVERIGIEQLVPNPDQPRRHFDETALAELAASIRGKGVIQPLIVRPKGELFEIVAGERRWRAAQRAQVHELPVVVRDFTDTEVLEIGIIENIQRTDLNPIEEASGYRALIERFGHTQEKLAEAMGKSRSHIANLMRLLSLPDEVQVLLRDGKLSAGHARALITADDPAMLARKVVLEGLSVRQTEALLKAPNSKPAAQKKPRSEKDADTRGLENDLSAVLDMKVEIDHRSDGKGTMTIRYLSMEQLDRLCAIIGTPFSKRGIGEEH